MTGGEGGTVTGGEERVFRLPDLGEGLTEAEVLTWRVAVGGEVAVDEVVVEVETAKAAVEVPVPFAGRVVALHAEVGGRVAVGGPLVTVAVPAGAAPAAAPAAASPEGEGDGAASGPVLVGYGTADANGAAGRGGGRGRRARRAAGARGRSLSSVLSSVGAAGPEPAEDAAAGARGAAAVGAGMAPRAISPLVRRLAAEHGLDLGALSRGTPGGVVRRRDVEAALAARDAPARPAAARPDRDGADGPGVGNGVGGGAEGEERVPLRGVRRAMAERVARSRREIPDATAWVDVDATELVAVRDQLRDAAPESGIGLLALVARMCVVGLARFPELHARVDAERGELVRLAGVNLGFAAQTERGLVVPVVRGADRLSTGGLAAELRRLTGAAKAGTLPPAALTGGTFTVNNYGVFGVDGSTPVINHPEAGMLGMGRVVRRPWVVDDALAVRWVTQLSVTFDHRVCDGGVAGGFLRFVADRVERPALLVADL